MENNYQKKLLIRGVIAILIIALYVFIGKQMVEPDPKGLGYFFLIFTGAVFTLVSGIILVIMVLTGKRHRTGNVLFILTAISNILMATVCFTMENSNILLHLICYSGVAVGLIQWYLLIKYFKKKSI